MAISIFVLLLPFRLYGIYVVWDLTFFSEKWVSGSRQAFCDELHCNRCIPADIAKCRGKHNQLHYG